MDGVMMNVVTQVWDQYLSVQRRGPVQLGCSPPASHTSISWVGINALPRRSQVRCLFSSPEGVSMSPSR